MSFLKDALQVKIGTVVLKLVKWKTKVQEKICQALKKIIFSNKGGVVKTDERKEYLPTGGEFKTV